MGECRWNYIEIMSGYYSEIDKGCISQRSYHWTKEPSGKGKRLIVVHIGSSDGFVPGGLFCFESKKISKITMTKWTMINFISGSTKFCRYWTKMPWSSWTMRLVIQWRRTHAPLYLGKSRYIINWLENKGEVVDHTKVKSQLLERAQVLKPQYEQYVIDELAKAAN